MIKHGFTIATCLLIWSGIVILRTQTLGIDAERIFAIVGNALAMYVLGFTVHKIICEKESKRELRNRTPK